MGKEWGEEMGKEWGGEMGKEWEERWVRSGRRDGEERWGRSGEERWGRSGEERWGRSGRRDGEGVGRRDWEGVGRRSGRSHGALLVIYFCSPHPPPSSVYHFLILLLAKSLNLKMSLWSESHTTEFTIVQCFLSNFLPTQFHYMKIGFGALHIFAIRLKCVLMESCRYLFVQIVDLNVIHYRDIAVKKSVCCKLFPLDSNNAPCKAYLASS